MSEVKRGDRLQGRVALVTGGGLSGSEMSIGRAIARVFAGQGATVGVLDIRAAAARATVAEIEAEGGAAFALEGDVTSEADCSRNVAEALDMAGRIDVLVNNVGIIGPAAPVTEVDEAAWDHVMAVNLKGVLLMTKHTLPVMGEGGAIVNISSIASIRPRHSTAYAVSKAALETLTRATAVQYASKGIRANGVLPGEVWTELMARTYDSPGVAAKAREDRRLRSLLKTEGTAWDIAHATLFLASDEARWITGQMLIVDGGFTHSDPRA